MEEIMPLFLSSIVREIIYRPIKTAVTIQLYFDTNEED